MATRRKAVEDEADSVQERAEAVVEAPDKRVVKYRGTATRRVITAEDWGRVGATDQPTTEWNFQNGFTVPITEFSSAALNYVQRDEKLFIEG